MPTVFNSNMVMERSCGDEVKYYFTILHLSPDWIWMRPEIAVNDFAQISYDGGDWHGSASYDFSDYGLSWEMTFPPPCKQQSNEDIYLYEGGKYRCVPECE